MKTLKTLNEFTIYAVKDGKEGLIFFENNKVMLKNVENNNTYYVSSVHNLDDRMFMTIYTDTQIKKEK